MRSQQLRTYKCKSQRLAAKGRLQQLREGEQVELEEEGLMSFSAQPAAVDDDQLGVLVGGLYMRCFRGAEAEVRVALSVFFFPRVCVQRLVFG